MKAVIVSLVVILGACWQSSSANDSLASTIDRDYAVRLEPLFLHFHANPELSHREFETSGRLAEEIGKHGYEITEGVGGTGVVAVMRNGSGPTVMIRADMDGLPVEEKSGLSYASRAMQEDIDGEVRKLCTAQCLVRDLVNTPTEHMGPQELADEVERIADAFDAEFSSINGADLLTRNFPAVHVVGRASHRDPRLLQLEWGHDGPLLVLVGKGVCFDTGGLDLKPAAGMALMKKDMGGAAHALALASLVMANNLPVRLMLLIPAVENAVAGNSYRPGDVISTRKGLSVEIGNTDAEGRVILSDALTFATEHDPDLVIDFATLTGAARVALGPELPPLFSNREEISAGILDAGLAVEDPLWSMPLHQPYNKLFESPIADLNNAGNTPFAGCITAALFLEHFVTPETPWVHIDTFAWNPASKPGRPKGGEAQGLRAVFAYLQKRYA